MSKQQKRQGRVKTRPLSLVSATPPKTKQPKTKQPKTKPAAHPAWWWWEN